MHLGDTQHQKLVRESIKFLGLSIRKSDFTSIIISPCLNLIKDHLLQQLFLTDQHINDFTENPIEFFNQMRSEHDDVDTVRNCILDFINLVSHYRDPVSGTLACMQDLFSFCLEHLNSKFEDPRICYKLKDVLLLFFSCLSSTVVATDFRIEECHKMFELLSAFLLKNKYDIQTQILKYRILSLFEEFWFLEMSKKTTENLIQYYNPRDNSEEGKILKY